MAVPTTMRTGSPFTALSTSRTTGSNSPASIITPKYRMAKSSSTPVGAKVRMPSSDILPRSPPKPARAPKASGTRISAIRAETRPLMTSTMKTTIMA